MSAAYDFLCQDLANEGRGKFSCCNTWTLAMVKVMLQFAEAYQHQCEMDRQKAERANDLQVKLPGR